MYYQKTVARNSGYSAHFTKQTPTIRAILEGGGIELATDFLKSGFMRQNRPLVEATLDFLYANGQFEIFLDCLDEYITKVISQEDNSFVGSNDFVMGILYFISENREYSTKSKTKSLWTYCKSVIQGEKIKDAPKAWIKNNPNRINGHGRYALAR
jgi:hypothetical protein